MSTLCISRRRLILGSALALSLTGLARAGDLIGPWPWLGSQISKLRQRSWCHHVQAWSS